MKVLNSRKIDLGTNQTAVVGGGRLKAFYTKGGASFCTELDVSRSPSTVAMQSQTGYFAQLMDFGDLSLCVSGRDVSVISR
jgi:hypothetical protein